jgi:hypothetical protein
VLKAAEMAGWRGESSIGPVKDRQPERMGFPLFFGLIFLIMIFPL